MVAALKDMQWR